MILLAALTEPLRRRRWREVLRERAPRTCTVAAAADLLGVDRVRFVSLLAGRTGRSLTLATALHREEIIRMLGGR